MARGACWQRPRLVVVDRGAGGGVSLWRGAVLALTLVVLIGGCGGAQSEWSDSRRLELSASAVGRSRIPTALSPGVLVPGTYTTSRFSVRMTFEVGEGWSFDTDVAGEVNFSLGGPASRASPVVAFVLLRYASQPDPPFAGDSVSDRAIARVARRPPEGYVGYLRSLDAHLDIQQSDSMVIAGRPAEVVEYRNARSPGDANEMCLGQPGGACFFSPTTFPPVYRVLAHGEAARSVVTETSRGPLLIEVTAPSSETLDAIVPSVDAMLSTLRFG
jgi:hypothetical protein